MSAALLTDPLFLFAAGVWVIAILLMLAIFLFHRP